jgi:hypothetical protein
MVGKLRIDIPEVMPKLLGCPITGTTRKKRKIGSTDTI